MSFLKFPALCLALALLTPAAPLCAGDVTSTISLLPAKNLEAFYVWTKDGVGQDPKGVFTLTPDGMVRITAGTGTPGYLATKEEYANYHLFAEYQWDAATTKGDSGVFVHCVGPDKWFMKSFECNIIQGKRSGEVILMDGATLVNQGKLLDKPYARIPTPEPKDYENPMGEWNTYEVLCKGSHLIVKVNGVTTVDATEASPSAGKVFLQSNQGTILFRRLELRPVE